MNNRLALGTAQFGMSYGIANQVGQVTHDEAIAILNESWSAGVNTLDTAIAYGESEKRLGEIGIENWQVITKLPTLPANRIDIDNWVKESVFGSLERLRIPKLSGILLHCPEQLHGHEGKKLFQSLVTLKEQNLVKSIGVSIYNPEELDALWSQFQFDIVQTPYNILDQRIATSGWLKRLNQAGIEVHVRSVFLQGLLLMEKLKRPEKFNHWQHLWDCWENWLEDQAMSPLQACLGFVLSQPEINRVLVGVDSLKQLKEVFAASSVGKSVVPPIELMSEDQNLIHPSFWSHL
jgi:hypothetical protein